jgi:hypothetical protein
MRTTLGQERARIYIIVNQKSREKNRPPKKEEAWKTCVFCLSGTCWVIILAPPEDWLFLLIIILGCIFPPWLSPFFILLQKHTLKNSAFL